MSSDKKHHQADLDQDGIVTETEIELRTQLDKSSAQMRIAVAALIAFVGTMLLLLTPLIPDDRIRNLSNVFDMYFLALASVIGAYMGFSAWMSRK